jgi:lipopolysaccharide assembly protein A
LHDKWVVAPQGLFRKTAGTFLGADMRFLYGLILLVLVGAVALFALQNSEVVTLRYLDRSASLAMPVLIGGVYLLGMLSGWTVVGFLNRSLRRATERRQG